MYSEPSELAERKTNRLKIKAPRYACIADLRIILLFSFNRVCSYSGAHHNAEMDLFGTECERTNRLQSNDIVCE